MEPVTHTLRIKGKFSTTDASAQTLALPNNIVDALADGEGVIRVECKVAAYNKEFRDEDYYFGSVALVLAVILSLFPT